MFLEVDGEMLGFFFGKTVNILPKLITFNVGDMSLLVVLLKTQPRFLLKGYNSSEARTYRNVCSLLTALNHPLSLLHSPQWPR